MLISGRKKGSITIKQYFLMFGIFAAAIMTLGIYLSNVKGAVDGTTLEKNYLARDMALLIDTLYAAPGDINYTYSMRDYKFDVDIGDGEVIMVDSGIVGVPTPYYYADDNAILPPDLEATEPKGIVFEKISGELKAKELKPEVGP